MLISSSIFFCFEPKEVEELVSKSCKKLWNLRPAETFVYCSQLLTNGSPSSSLIIVITSSSLSSSSIPDKPWVALVGLWKAQQMWWREIWLGSSLMDTMDSGKSTWWMEWSSTSSASNGTIPSASALPKKMIRLVWPPSTRSTTSNVRQLTTASPSLTLLASEAPKINWNGIKKSNHCRLAFSADS